MKRYRVELQTKPGLYAQYNQTCSVFANDDDEAAYNAVTQMTRGAFKGYSRSMWIVRSVHREWK